MKFSLICITLLPALAAAHAGFKRQSDVPTCALPCIATVGGNCQTGDVACYCSDPTTIQNIQTCLQQNCQGDDLQSASTAAAALCAENGVSTTFDAPTTSATPTDNAEGASSTSEVSAISDPSASLVGVTSAIEASASSAVGAIRSSASAAVASGSSVRGTISSSLVAASSSRAAASSSAAAASASSSGAATPTGRVGKGVVAGALMVAGGLVAGL